jgi:hypothetical protein
VSISIAGEEFLSAPESYLEDSYGADWQTPKNFTYQQGVDFRLYTNCQRF